MPGCTLSLLLLMCCGRHIDWQSRSPCRNTKGVAGPLSDVRLYVCSQKPTDWSVLLDYDICLQSFLDHNGPPYAGIDASSGGAQDAMDDVYVSVPAKAVGNIFLVIELVDTNAATAGLELYVQWWWSGTISFPAGQFSGAYSQGGPTTTPQGNTPAAMSIGAANFLKTPGYGVTPAVREPFSSRGIIPIYYNAQGVKYGQPQFNLKPDILAPDGTDTSFFGDDWDARGASNGYKNFYGTSAAAPHAAATGALMLQLDPTMQADTMYLQMRAFAENAAAFDNWIGFGFIQPAKFLRLCGPPPPNVPDGLLSACSPPFGVGRRCLGQCNDRYAPENGQDAPEVTCVAVSETTNTWLLTVGCVWREWQK